MLKLRMRRVIHIAVTLLAVVALITPLDCFTTGMKTREGAACCLKGECYRSANADDCCKNTAPDGSWILAPTASNHHVPLVIATLADNATLVLSPVFQRLTSKLRHGPPKPSLATLNLPLLI
jgi:hypothetical protein